MGKTVLKQKPCPICGNSGKIIDEKCHVCHGHGIIQEKHTLSVLVERGMKDGDEIVFENEGSQYIGLKARTLVVQLKQQEHKLFKREGNDLKLTHRITLKEALLGWRHNITHLDGHIVTIGKSGVTRNGEVIVVEEEGMPVHQFPSQKGNLLITIQVEMPKKLNDQQLQDIEKYF